VSERPDNIQSTLVVIYIRLRLKCDGIRAETRFRVSAKRTSLFKSAGASVQSTTGTRGVRISGSNVGYTMFRGSVKSTGYPIHSPISPSLPFPCVTLCNHISTGRYQRMLSPSWSVLMLWRNKLLLLRRFIKIHDRLALCNRRPTIYALAYARTHTHAHVPGTIWLVNPEPNFPAFKWSAITDFAQLRAVSCTDSPRSALELPESKGGGLYYLPKRRYIYQSTQHSIPAELAHPSSGTFTTSRVLPLASYGHTFLLET